MLTPPSGFRDQFRTLRSIRHGRTSNLWLYLRYQALSKLLFSLLVLPGYNWALRALIHSSGRSVVSSGDISGFLLSWQAAVAMVISAALVILVVCLDIVAFVQLELSRLRGEPLPTARHMLVSALAAYPRFFHPGSLVLLAYVLILTPLVGFGPQPEALEWLAIPNFVMDVIVHNPTYLAAYSTAIAALAVLSFFLLAMFPAMLAHNLSPWGAMRESFAYMRKYWLINLVGLGLYTLGVLAITAATLGALAVISLYGIPLVAESELSIRFTTLLAVLIAAGAIGLVLLFLTPSMLRELTRVYAMLHDATTVRPDVYKSASIREDRRARPWLIGTVAVSVVGAVALAGVAAANFDAIFRSNAAIEVAAHRGGGDLDAENTVDGLLTAASVGAKWSEFDVQRTADGHYVINHDESFSRVAGEPRGPKDMTLAEIADLRVRNNFDPARPSRAVAKLEDMLDAAKGTEGKIRLFIELKGSTADRRMVDDVAAMIRERGMEKQAAMISLDENLIRYAEERNPDLMTGFLYFFALGDTEKLPADFLMMEEQAATDGELSKLHEAGKKTVVWTVNTEASIAKFTIAEVDAIITDHPTRVLQELTQRRLRSDLELVVEELLSF
nr:glycerophosphodiester phosphodiesterase family protein [Corynebacterium lactis]